MDEIHLCKWELVRTEYEWIHITAIHSAVVDVVVIVVAQMDL